MKKTMRWTALAVLLALLTAAPAMAASYSGWVGSTTGSTALQFCDDLAAEVIERTNAERARQGLGALRADAELTRAARVRAEELTRRFSHTRPDGARWATVSAQAFAENIARGQRTAAKVVAAWLTSRTGHRENLLRPSYGSIGVCAVVYRGVTYWVQLFGR